ncbi:MAG: hypothetical protein ACYCQJ_15240 [Nitrososphaerales archaeon]
MSVFQGETIRLEALVVTDLNGNLVTAPTSITITLYKPNATTTVITTGITNDGNGNYHYDYTFASTDPIGGWKQNWTFVSGGDTFIFESTFNVSAP